MFRLSMCITLERALEEMKLTNNSVRGKATSQQKQWQSINGKLPIRVHESTCIMHDTRVTIVLTRESSMRESAGRARESLIRAMWTIGAISKSTQRGTAHRLPFTSKNRFNRIWFSHSLNCTRNSFSHVLKILQWKSHLHEKLYFSRCFFSLWNRFLLNF